MAHCSMICALNSIVHTTITSVAPSGSAPCTLFARSRSDVTKKCYTVQQSLFAAIEQLRIGFTPED